MEGNKELRDPQATQSFWNARWENRQTGWDIGYASPALTQYIDGLTDKDIAILIPGCGNAYEATYLIAKGFSNITLIDIAPIAVANAQEKFKDHPEVKVILGNFFELEESYDLILEQTFFCAIDPSLRPQYIQKMASLLKPSGRLVGVLFNIDFEKEGPPFGGHIAEYHPAFAAYFDIHKMEACYNSIQPRQGSELFINLIKK